VWLGDGSASQDLVASRGGVPDTAEIPAHQLHRGTLHRGRDADGSPVCAAVSTVPGDHVVVTFWARFAPHDHLGPARLGALEVLVTAGVGAMRRTRSNEHARDAGRLLQ